MMMSRNHAESVNGVRNSDVLEALEAIVSSAEFLASPHLAAFLTYCVTETLEGRASGIKAYTVATGVLGRPPYFDPQTDPIVRVEATRLRRAMERYYSGIGSSDPVRIEMPRGGYQVNFTGVGDKSDLPQGENPFADKKNALPGKRPGIMVSAPSLNVFRQHPYWITLLVLSVIVAGWTWNLLPLPQSAFNAPAKNTASVMALDAAAKIPAELSAEKSAKTGQMARGFRIGGVKVGTFAVEGNASMPWHVGAKISEEFTEALSRFDAIAVYDWRSATQPNDPDIYEISGRAVVDGPQTNTISVRIVHVASQRMVWSRDYARTSASRPGSFWRQDIIRAVATTIASNDGVILRDFTSISAIDDPATVAKYCVLRAMEVLRLPDPERKASSRECIDAALAIYPETPTLLGLSARLRLEVPDTSPAALKLALGEAQRANIAAPQSALITNILADVNTRLGLTQRATQLGKLAVELNPYDVTVLAAQANRLSAIGDEAGAEELRSQIEPEFKAPALINNP